MCIKQHATNANQNNAMQEMRKIMKSSPQLATRLFFLFALRSPELGGELLLSEAFPGVSTRTCGVDTLPGGPEGVLTAAVADASLGAGFGAGPVARSVSPAARDKMKEPGSPTSGVSSMNSSPYRVNKLNASPRLRVSW